MTCYHSCTVHCKDILVPTKLDSKIDESQLQAHTTNTKIFKKRHEIIIYENAFQPMKGPVEVRSLHFPENVSMIENQ